MSKMPFKSVCYLYGVLSEKPVEAIDALTIIGRDQRLEGFLLDKYLSEKRIWTLYGIVNKCTALMRNTIL